MIFILPPLSCSARYKFASSHFKRILSWSSSWPRPVAELCRREAEARRAADEDRRLPAFCRVFCRVSSFDSCGSREIDGGLKGVSSAFGGELWRPMPGPDGPEKDGFFRIPSFPVSLLWFGSKGMAGPENEAASTVEHTFWSLGHLAGVMKGRR